MSEIETQCCVVGGGPAGMMLGLLLARAGVDVVVLEKHRDFLRDFRGDTIHPSTLEILYELGLLEDFLKLPHQQTKVLHGQVGTESFQVVDFSHLPTHCQFMAVMPQWDFLDFIAAQARRYPNFHLMMETEATDLLQEGNLITGVKAKASEGTAEIHASLVIGADGRSSLVRNKAGLTVDELGAPMDVLWFRLSRRPGDPDSLGRFDSGHILVLINRSDYWQCGFVIPKGAADELRQRGLDDFRSTVARLEPFLDNRVSELTDWEKVKLLTVRVDRLRRWYRAGLLCIGDAAHAMSPIGGVGINLAIQDAVAAANSIARPLRERRLTDEHLRMVQQRRLLPTRVIQGIQIQIQRRVIARVLGSTAPARPAWIFRMIARAPLLQRFNARLVGIGVRQEHVSSPSPA